MGLKERIKKIQEFEDNLEAKKSEAEQKRNKQVEDVKRGIHQILIKKLSDEIFKKNISDAELKLKVTKEINNYFSTSETPLSMVEKNSII